MSLAEINTEDREQLPPGWRWVELEKTCDIIAGQSPPGHTYNKNSEGLPFFQGKADFGISYPIPAVWCNEPIKIALPGDILVSVRAPVPTFDGDAKVELIKRCFEPWN